MRTVEDIIEEINQRISKFNKFHSSILEDERGDELQDLKEWIQEPEYPLDN